MVHSEEPIVLRAQRGTKLQTFSNYNERWFEVHAPNAWALFYKEVVVAERGFDLSAMKLAILQCDKNIKIFEDAIQKELNTKIEYQRIVRELEFKAANPPKVSVEVVRESGQETKGAEEDD